MTKLPVGTRTCTCERDVHDTQLIAVTGGPSAGKTALLQMALRSFCTHVAVLPEAASVVFGGGFPRHASDVGRRAAQRAIYHVQREVEALVVGEAQAAIGLCDRGTVDGVAYWPHSATSYWEAVETTAAAEQERYAAVIHMRTPAAGEGYDRSNELRIESAREARALDEQILAAWQDHPARLVIESEEEFVAKATRALEHVRSLLPPCCRTHPLSTSTVDR